MAAKKTKYKINVPLLAAVVLFILLVVTVSLNPGIKAKYLSQDSSDDSARVAKWKIDSLDANGASLDKTIDFNQKITTEGGFYFFEIQNASEVSAILDSDSQITIELSHENFIGALNNPSWDFLGSDNPIDFRVVLYDAALNEVVSSDGSGNISLKDASAITQMQLFTTVGYKAPLIDKHTSGNRTYVLNFPLSEAFNNNLGSETIRTLSHGNDKLTIGIFWDVDSTASGGSGDTNIESKRYMLYDLVTIKPTGYSIASGTDSDGYFVEDPNGDKKTFYIVEKEVNFADYFIVSAGEPTFTFKGRFEGTEVQVPYSDVIDDDTLREELENRKISESNVTYSDLDKYIEMLEYKQYKNFSTDKTDFIKAQSYMQYGFSVNVLLDLRVSQKD